VGRRPGSGRRRITSAQDDEGIIDIIQNRPFTTAIVEVNQTNFPASVVTARRRLKGAGLRNHSAVQKPILTPLHKELRLGFSWKHEKVFQSSPNGRLRVYRPRGTRYVQGGVTEFDHDPKFVLI
jgi:hypothetical protein